MTAEEIRRTLTDRQLELYADLELEAQADERALESYGVLAAIGQAFGAKNAIKAFVQKLNPGSGTAGDSTPMAKLRERINRLMKIGVKVEGEVPDDPA